MNLNNLKKKNFNFLKFMQINGEVILKNSQKNDDIKKGSIFCNMKFETKENKEHFNVSDNNNLSEFKQSKKPKKDSNQDISGKPTIQLTFGPKTKISKPQVITA